MKKLLAIGLLLLVAAAPAWASHRQSRCINCPPSATIWVNGVPYAPPPAPPGIEVKAANPPTGATTAVVPILPASR
jgi:hypothetical protein